jgi:cellulose synthase (UDP-forming)
VAQVDTDFVVKPNFLTETLGQFKDPEVAFVVTPQFYGNEHDSVVAAGAGQQTFSFYGPIQRGLSGIDTTMLVGANHIIRVSALKEIGWYVGHLTEDLYTGMMLYSRGWKGKYYPKVLAVGEGPATWSAYFTQQMRWSRGCFDILFRGGIPLILKMNFKRQFTFFFLMQHYFSGFNLIVGTALLSLYFITGFNAVNITSSKLLIIYACLILWLMVMSFWQQSYNVRPKHEKGYLLPGRIVQLAVQPVYFLALIAAIRNKKFYFKVTPKGGLNEQPNEISLFKIHISLGLIVLVALIIGLLHHRISPVLVFWAVANVTIMAVLVLTVLVGNKIHQKIIQDKELRLRATLLS